MPDTSQVIDHTLISGEERSDDPEAPDDDGHDGQPSSEERSLEITTDRLPLTLNDEFAVPRNKKSTWGQGSTQRDVFCMADPEDDDTPSVELSTCVCYKCLGAERVGNMPVLWARRLPGKPTEVLCVAGPFWPCMVGVTYPLIFLVSIYSAVMFLPSAPAWVVGLWVLATLTVLVSLALTACSNPGIVRRYTEEPPNTTGWRWSDQAQSFRPRTSRYDRDCGLVIDEFDHTCPWTGTGIGRDNMMYFQVFTSCVCGCLIFNIILMVKFGDTIEGL
mmetsp:Transcript_51993/g.96736  ORF Transcript_51993/g.96736 Transcript_51993/m.96736 type:complete len:275 (+) Transcript_51993:99-923(+)